MKQAAPKNARPEARLLCGLIALLFLGYLVEIFTWGAPDFRRRSQRVYHRETDPVPFWFQFTVSAAIGTTAAYYGLNWNKALPLIEASEAEDRQRLAAMAAGEAKREREKRERSLATMVLAVLVIFVLLIVTLIMS